MNDRDKLRGRGLENLYMPETVHEAVQYWVKWSRDTCKNGKECCSGCSMLSCDCSEYFLAGQIVRLEMEMKVLKESKE